MDSSFKAGKIFELRPVWSNSLELLKTFGVEAPAFVKRMITEGALNLFDVDLFGRNLLACNSPAGRAGTRSSRSVTRFSSAS